MRLGDQSLILRAGAQQVISNTPNGYGLPCISNIQQKNILYSNA